ncbi:class I SAM-dependent methyltransferase [Candidatus Bipolaricaulota bacterium]|nr:class I SAM-dependent methyltransferase [Candidatus Bipolaricaulota bacterium]
MTDIGLPGNSENMALFFDTRAISYERHMQEAVEDFSLFYRGITEALPELGNAPRILDLGIGTGLELNHLFERFPGAKVTGIDLSSGMLAELVRKNPPWIGNLRLINDSFLDLDLGRQAYDAVISSMVLHHWTPRIKLEIYRRIHATLLPDGTFVNGDFIVPTDESARRLALFAASQIDERHQLHIDLPLSLDCELQLLTNAGFSAIVAPFRRSHAVILAASKSQRGKHNEPEQFDTPAAHLAP